LTVIAATSYTSRILVDGTLAMTIHIEPSLRDAAIALFGAPGSEMGIAALKTAKAAPAPKGGELARWVAMRCQEAAFQRWAQEQFPKEWAYAKGDTPTAWAASVVRDVCGIESRAELDSNEAAAKRFHALVRKPFEAA
jgi:hypothetical protein